MGERLPLRVQAQKGPRIVGIQHRLGQDRAIAGHYEAPLSSPLGEGGSGVSRVRSKLVSSNHLVPRDEENENGERGQTVRRRCGESARSCRFLVAHTQQ